MSWISNNSIISKLIVVALYLFSASTALFAQSKGYGVEVRTASVGRFETVPGRILSASFLVTNRMSINDRFIESVNMPDDWQLVTPPSDFALDPQEGKVRILAFSIPANTPAGRYEMTYFVRNRNALAQDTQTVSILILPVSKLEILAEDKPDVALAGDEYQVRARLVNRCNYKVKLAVEVKSGEKLPAKLDISEVYLNAGGSKVITASVKTDKKMTRRTTDFLQIQAKADGSRLSAGLSLAVEIVPRMTAKMDPYHKLPAKIQMVSTDERDGSGFQTEFSGAGKLNEFGEDSIDFLFRSSGAQNSSFYGAQDEYRFNYHSSAYDLMLGDQSYGLSHLTDFYHYGRGMGFQLRDGKEFGYGANFIENRWDYPKVKESSFYVSRQINDKLKMKVNMLNKNRSSAPASTDNIWSLEAFAKPFKDANLLMELANCSSDRNGNSNDGAYQIGVDGKSRGISYAFGKTHAGPDYFGYYHNCDYTNGSVSVPINDRLRSQFSIQRWEGNVGRDQSKGDAPVEHYYQAGLFYDCRSGTNISLSYDGFRRRDTLESEKYDYKERSVRIGFGTSSAYSGLQAYVNLGKQKDLLTGGIHRASRYSVYYTLRPSPTQYFTIYSQFGGDGPRETRLIGENNALGASLNWKPAENFSLYANYAINGFDSEMQRLSHQFNLKLVYDLQNESSWMLTLRQLNGSSYRDSAVVVIYTRPWDLPLSRKRNIGVLMGKIFDVEAPGQAGFPRAIVTVNGASTATDGNGEFKFNCLPPGNYSVSVEQGSIGLNRVTQVKLPLVVAVKGEETAHVRIPIIRSAQLLGKVAEFAYRPTENAPSAASTKPVSLSSNNIYLEGLGGTRRSDEVDRPVVEKDGIANVLMELTNGTETLRRLTDAKGSFSLEGLRPGRWHLKVYDDNLPPYHYLEAQDVDIELKAGAAESVVVRVLPKLRPIKIIEQGTMTCSINLGNR